MNDAKQSLIPIMNGQYDRIVAIEAQWGIRLHEGDQRPRIDYFHDAVRALTSGEADIYDKYSRLSVEHLAYDMACLREAQRKPLGKLRDETALSPHTDVALQGNKGGSAPRMGRAEKRELSELYKDYTVLFAALFAEIADMSFQGRSEEVDSAIDDIKTVEQTLKQLAEGQIDAAQAKAMVDHLEQDALRERIMQAIESQTIRHAQAEQMIAQLRGAEGKMKAEMQAINQAHFNYKTSQLAVYEESKETLKRLAAQGMNLAGKHVEQALAQTSGKGVGLDR